MGLVQTIVYYVVLAIVVGYLGWYLINLLKNKKNEEKKGDWS